jgi:MFS superfamily sulfate permease-like transporter
LQTLGSFQAFLLACGEYAAMGSRLLKAGVIGAFFPSDAIKGMMAAIGLILIIKQVPHAVGNDVSFEGDEDYMAETAESSFLNCLILYMLPRLRQL